MSQSNPSSSMAHALGYGRVFLYAVESLPVIYTRRLLGAIADPNLKIPDEHITHVREDIRRMIEQDAKNIDAGLYPESLLYPESPLRHLIRYASVLADVFSTARRFKQRQNKSFSSEAESHLEDVPEYYRRNFHFQTDGYLSDHSARIYEHQTEILFRGTIGLMRRILLAPMIQEIQSRRGLVRVLEIGCGAGEATKIILEACPNVKYEALDLSTPYIKRASHKLREFDNIAFHRMDGADAAALPGKFDYVFSCFLMHELPQKERQKIVDAAFNCLKPGGKTLHIDSIQMGERPEYDWSLGAFPKDFHEPFFANYVKTPMAQLIQSAGFDNYEEASAFFSKSIMAKR